MTAISFLHDGDAIVCGQCRQNASMIGPGRFVCHRCQYGLNDEPEKTAPGLGDRIEMGLSAIGITKARVQRVASAVGITDCGCGKRQALANAFGAKYLGLPPGKSSTS